MQENQNAAAEWRPERPVELVAGTPAGGGQDRPARALIEVLAAERLIEVPVSLVNIPGRGGGNAWDHLAGRSGDPHVLAVNSPTILTNRLLGVSDLAHSALTPVANLYTEYLLFAVRADSPIADAAALRARLRANTAGLAVAYATAVGNMNHIALAEVTRAAGGDIAALCATVFDSARHAVAHVIEGKAELAVISATSAAPELGAGSLRGLAVSAPARLSGLFAQVPTWRDCGVDCVVGTWRGLIGAAGLTEAQVAFWERTFTAAARSPAWRAELARHHWSETFLGAADTCAFLDREYAAARVALAELGLITRSR